MDFIALLQAAQNRDRIFYIRRIYEHRLEAALQRLVFFDMLAVFIQGGGADTVQFATGQHRLEHIAGVCRALCPAGSDNGMQLVDKQDDTAFSLFDFPEHSLEAFLKFTTVFGPGHERCHIQREDRAVFQVFRHVPAQDALGKPLGNGGFADTGLTDEDRVVFGLA